MAYQVDNAGASGKGLFGTRDIGPSEVIFKLSRPLVTSLDTPALDYTCEWCFEGTGEAALGQSPVDQEGHSGFTTREIKLSRCTGCRLVKYCSKVCFMAPIPFAILLIFVPVLSKESLEEPPQA